MKRFGAIRCIVAVLAGLVFAWHQAYVPIHLLAHSHSDAGVSIYNLHFYDPAHESPHVDEHDHDHAHEHGHDHAPAHHEHEADHGQAAGQVDHEHEKEDGHERHSAYDHLSTFYSVTATVPEPEAPWQLVSEFCFPKNEPVFAGALPLRGGRSPPVALRTHII